ncbi:hypothetical protein Pan258_03030 [Symmachiella dynata]|uniref:hypothetical protein n=1 Tax=Symmachiella dynata TaxID=2527995 RepID=UPI001189B509|nr:hypothetical protein [Symmachiella dynata]QDT46285.1 hypothetical protein Pan258_03030 [Symmachiella dynata]
MVKSKIRPDYSNKQDFHLLPDDLHHALCHSVINSEERSEVVLATAVIDDILERILRTKFKFESGAGDKEIDKILCPKYPQATLVGLSSRCRMARMLGLIDEPTSNAIRALASIRNQFAHLKDPPELTEPLLQDVVNKMSKDCQNQFDVILAAGFFPLHDAPARFLLYIFMVLYDELQLDLKEIANLTNQSPNPQ